jgi:ribosomal protein S16
MSIIKLKKNRKTTTNNNSYYAQVLTTKNRTSKLNLGAYDQKQNMLILDLKNFIFWIKKGAAISGNFNKILKKASKSLQNNKKIAINIKY